MQEASSRIAYRAIILIYLVLAQSQFTPFDAHYFPEVDIKLTRLSEPKNYSGRVEPKERTVPGADHVVRLLVNSVGVDYWIECRIRVGSSWTKTTSDMEKIVVDPTMQFAELYFTIPANAIKHDRITIALVSLGQTNAISAYRVEVAVKDRAIPASI